MPGNLDALHGIHGEETTTRGFHDDARALQRTGEPLEAAATAPRALEQLGLHREEHLLENERTKGAKRRASRSAPPARGSGRTGSADTGPADRRY